MDELLTSLYGDGAWEIAKSMSPAGRRPKDNFMRGAAIAGTATGAALGVSEIGESLRETGKLTRIASKIPKLPANPKVRLGVAGTMLGTDLLATNELRKPKDPAAVPKQPKNVIKSAKLIKQDTTDETLNAHVVSKKLDMTWRGEISKVDSDKRQVFGWASIIEINGEPVVDLQGDYMTLETIEKAAYDYVRNSRKGGNQHEKTDEGPRHVSDMIESFLVTDEKKKQMGLPDSTPTGWWVGFQVNDDDTWRQVKNGERKEFSIHGSGVRKDLMLED